MKTIDNIVSILCAEVDELRKDLDIVTDKYNKLLFEFDDFRKKSQKHSDAVFHNYIRSILKGENNEKIRMD